MTIAVVVVMEAIETTGSRPDRSVKKKTFRPLDGGRHQLFRCMAAVCRGFVLFLYSSFYQV